MRSVEAGFNPAMMAKSRVGAWLQGGYDYAPAATMGLEAKGLVNRAEIEASALEQAAQIGSQAQIDAANSLMSASNSAFQLRSQAFN